MPENFEVVYSHPGGATATFIRHDGELDALAKGLDAEQFWVFKNVKALLVRNEPGDLEESNRLMSRVGFAANVRVITAPEPAFAVARAEAVDITGIGEEEHAGPHLPGPSYWPVLLAASAFIALGGLLFVQTTLVITALGMILTFACGVAWGLEPA